MKDSNYHWDFTRPTIYLQHYWSLPIGLPSRPIQFSKTYRIRKPQSSWIYSCLFLSCFQLFFLYFQNCINGRIGKENFLEKSLNLQKKSIEYWKRSMRLELNKFLYFSKIADLIPPEMNTFVKTINAN